MRSLLPFWQLASHLLQILVTDGVEMAISGRLEHTGGLVAHSDNGSQYTSYEYTERLKMAGIAPSRGRTGTALDRKTYLDLELALTPAQVLERHNQQTAERVWCPSD